MKTFLLDFLRQFPLGFKESYWRQWHFVYIFNWRFFFRILKVKHEFWNENNKNTIFQHFWITCNASPVDVLTSLLSLSSLLLPTNITGIPERSPLTWKNDFIWKKSTQVSTKAKMNKIVPLIEMRCLILKLKYLELRNSNQGSLWLIGT